MIDVIVIVAKNIKNVVGCRMLDFVLNFFKRENMIVEKIKRDDSIISITVQEEIEARVKAFNAKHLSKRSSNQYHPVIKRKFIYLMALHPNGCMDDICRLTYNGHLERMDFAIYKYSSDKYDPKENFFPGSECVNGTLEGAMKAGIKAYW